jgi:hypothetical protein
MLPVDNALVMSLYRAIKSRCIATGNRRAMLRVTLAGWLLRDPEDRPQHGDVVATLAVPDASRSLGTYLTVHIRATGETTKDALRAMRRSNRLTVMGRARCAEQAGRTRGFEKWVLYVDAGMVIVGEPFTDPEHWSGSVAKRLS